MAEVITVELRQSSKFIREYANPKFAEFLRTHRRRRSPKGRRRASCAPSSIRTLIARALFGALDEIALAWLVQTPPRGQHRQRIDLARAAEQLGTLLFTSTGSRRTE